MDLGRRYTTCWSSIWSEHAVACKNHEVFRKNATLLCKPIKNRTSPGRLAATWAWILAIFQGHEILLSKDILRINILQNKLYIWWRRLIFKSQLPTSYQWQKSKFPYCFLIGWSNLKFNKLTSSICFSICAYFKQILD